MLNKLEKNQYARIQPLFHELRYNLVIDSTLDGNTPGWVYADNPAKPRSALIWNKQDALLLAGGFNNDAFNQDLRATVLEEIIPDAKSRDAPSLVWQYHPKPWNKILSQTFNAFEGSRALCRYYNFDRPRINWRNRLPDGHRILPINLPLLENPNFKQIQEVAAWIESFWNTGEDFLKQGFGYCLVKKNEIISWCLSVYASGKDYELRLASQPSHQDKGLDTLVAAACVEHCSQRDLNPHWHCWNDDLASIAVAERVGFENPVKYSVYRMKLRSGQNQVS